MAKFSIESLKRIYNDDTGEYIEVRPDGDSLGLIEIASYDSNGEQEARLTMSKDQAILLGAILSNAHDRQVVGNSDD